MPQDASQDKEVPQETQAKESLNKEIASRWAATETHYKNWNTMAKEDYDFALGEQFTQKEKEELTAQGRPALVFNRIRPLINLLSGYQRENSSRIKVNPEGGEDKIFSEVMDRIVKAIDKWSHMNYKLGYTFDDGAYCGKGFIEAMISYDKDPVRGEIKWKTRTPYQILPDPECLEYDLNEGAGFCFKIVRLPRSKILELYPEKANLINGFKEDSDNMEVNGEGSDPMVDGSIMQPADDDYGNDPHKRNYTSMASGTAEGEKILADEKFTIKEYWRVKQVPRYFVIDKESGDPRRFKTKEEAEKFISEQNFGKVIDRKVNEMHVAARCCGWILQDEISPMEPYYSGYPFFRYMADWAPNASNEVLRVQGITRPLKDPQREKNKAKSQYLHIVNTQANSGWIGDKDALTKGGWAALEKLGSKPGVVIKKKKGSELREIQAKTPSQGHLVREQQADEEFKQISNINPDLLGFSDKTASGRAISMRIKQAVLALVRLFYNYRYTKEIIGLFLLQMIPALFDAKKVMKVLGPQYMKEAVDKEKYPEGLNKGHIEGFLQMIEDSKYDLMIAEAEANTTIRYEIFQELTELLKAGAPIPVEMLIDYMDLPNSQEVKDKIKEVQAQQAAAEASGNNK